MPELDTRPRRTARVPRAVAAIAGLVLLLAACGSSTATPSIGGSPGASLSPTGSTAATSSGPDAVGSPITPADRLTQAFDAMANGYTFDSTITVGGKVATHATGRWFGGSSEFVIESSGIAITYRTIPPLAWVLNPGSDWVIVDGAIPGGDPLDALSAPQATNVSGDDAAGLHLVGTYAAADLGLAGTGTVPVSLLLAPDGSITATYSGGATAGAAASVVVLRPAATVEPIVAPSPLAKPS